MRVANISASRTSCVTKMAVLPRSRRRARNCFCKSRRVTGSTAPNGSSNNSTDGSAANARATPTRCRWPPESWAGTGCVSCSPVLACRVCSHMLMTETTAVNEEVLDAVAELTNMIIGSVKNDLERELGPLGLSIPTVVFGKNFRTKSAGHAEWIVRRFHWDSDAFEVRICLAPSEHPAGLQPGGFGQENQMGV